LYGAIFEQIRELKKFDIPCKVILGVTAAFAAASKMNMEYTLPEIILDINFNKDFWKNTCARIRRS
jgi:precorrin-4 methylase